MGGYLTDFRSVFPSGSRALAPICTSVPRHIHSGNANALAPATRLRSQPTMSTFNPKNANWPSDQPKPKRTNDDNAFPGAGGGSYTLDGTRAGVSAPPGDGGGVRVTGGPLRAECVKPGGRHRPGRADGERLVRCDRTPVDVALVLRVLERWERGDALERRAARLYRHVSHGGATGDRRKAAGAMRRMRRATGYAWSPRSVAIACGMVEERDEAGRFVRRPEMSYG